MPGELSDFVGSISTAITRRADRYVETLAGSRSDGILGPAEAALLDRFEVYVADVLDRYVPPGPRTRDKLVFAQVYAVPAGLAPEERERSVITALLAAEVETRGPLRLTPAQTTRLARILESLGRDLAAGLPLHSAHAFDLAGGLYLQVAENAARDRCQLFALRARHRARAPGWRKALEALSDVLCGYGYQPYRLLGWVVVQLAGFSLVLVLILGTSVSEGIFICLANYLNPLGIGDARELRHGAWPVLLVESYTGSVSLSVFFALLVRRWFRL